MCQSARRPHLQTQQLAHLAARSRARRREWEQMFARHLTDAQARLREAYEPIEIARKARRDRRIQATHDGDLDRSEFRLGTSGRKPQLWQLDGDRS